MALTLLMATIAVQAGQATPPPKAALPIPDVLLAYADDSVEAEKALNEGKLDPTKLLFLQTKRPVVVCYGRLAEVARRRQGKSVAIVDLVKNGGGSYWSKERSDTLRRIMDDSPFRDEIRNDAAKGYAIPAQIHRLTSVDFMANGRHQSIRLPMEPLGKSFDLPTDSLRLASLSPVLPPALVGPGKRGNAVACIVSRSTSKVTSLPLMQAGLKLLAAREKADDEALAEILPPSTGSEVTEAERDVVLQDLAVNFGAYGFVSAEAAQAAFRSADPRKHSSIGITLTPQTPESRKNTIGWTILGL